MLGRRTFVLGAAVLAWSCARGPEEARSSSGGQARISQLAYWSYELRAPECWAPEACLAEVDGCAGSESYAPNTLFDACPETVSCSQSDAYVDRLSIEPVAGARLIRGELARASVFVWNGSAASPVYVDFYRAADATHPAWVYLGTATFSAYGLNGFSLDYVLPAGLRQAIRAALRPSGQGSPSPCPAGGAGDRDDLAFAVEPGDTTPPTVALVMPTDGEQLLRYVSLQAEADDAPAAYTGIKRLEFYAGSTLLGADLGSPPYFSMLWDAGAFAPGTYTLTARATDGAGNVAVSAPVTIALLGDSAPPQVTVDVPATVAGVVAVTAGASDEFEVARVELWTGDTLLAVDDAPPYWTFRWDTTALPNGAYALTARAVDASGNVGTSPPVTVTIDNPPGTAAWSAALRAPLCAEVGAACDSSNHLAGRGPAELHGPSTIHASCADGALSASHAPQALEGLRVETEDGGPLEEGKVVLVRARVLAGTSIAPRYADLFAAGDAAAPAWRYLTTLQGAGDGTLTGRYTLGAGGLQALRVRYSDFSRVVPCTPSPSYDDHDDLAFAVAPGAPDVTPPAVAVTAPAAGAALNGPFHVLVNASDDRLMGYVEVLVDGSARPPILAPPYDASLETGSFATGFHAISARARDAAGNVAVSPPVTVWLGPPDTTPPSVAVTMPTSYVGLGPVLTKATASDNVGVARVDFFVNGALIGSDTTAPFQTIWDTSGMPIGTYQLTARAFDTSGNSTVSAVRYAAVSGNAAAWDPVLRAGRCGPTSRCDSYDLLSGRGPLGPEAWAPSTIGGSCADGTAGSFHVEPSLDQIAVYSTGGTTLEGGGMVRIDVRVWAQYWSAEVLHLYHAPDATQPSWTLIATLAPSVSGTQWLSTTYVLPAGPLQAIRARYRAGGAPGPCGAGPNDDHDDLVFAVAPETPDTAPPSVSLTAPLPGAQVSGAVTLAATAADNRGVTRVDFLADGAVIATDATSPYAGTWAAAAVAPGNHVLGARAYDAAGNSAASAPVTVAVRAPTGAAYDAAYRTAACAAVSGRCDSGTLLIGRATLGPEANAPNTIGGACPDGTGGSFHGDESVDAIEVATVDGSPMAPGKVVRVTARVWAYSSYTSDALDLYASASAASPSWTLLGTFTPAGPKEQTLTTQYTLPAGAVQAVRAQFRYGAGTSPCTTGTYNDHDDLVFAVGP